MVWAISRFAVLAAALITAGVARAEEQVLYWMVNDNATVSKWDDTSSDISDFFADVENSSGYGDFAARVRVIGGNIPEGTDKFLDLYIPGCGVDVGGGQYGVNFDKVGGYWGAGVPTGNQSPAGTYSAGTPEEYSFVVELGNFDSDDNWTTVAWSAAVTYSGLGGYIHQTFDINPSPLYVWTPNVFYAAPEPAGGLLFIVGGALLALRRRKIAVAAP